MSDPVTTISIVAYLASTSMNGRRTVDTVRELAAEHPEIHLDLEVIDVLSDASRAEEDRVLATPTVIRLAPLPRVRLVGDLSAAHQRDEIDHLLFDL